jgi:hypothetical protein
MTITLRIIDNVILAHAWIHSKTLSKSKWIWIEPLPARPE